ncbi:hypothetical protein [Streptomyces sp. NPDC059850]|uniref:hypothetical protein n=1 Tax=Streptomyces sp. NPDC059850 TaxID=3346970 RepID=UPI00365BAC29
MGGGFPPTWTHSPDGLAVKAGDAEESIFSGVDPALAAQAAHSARVPSGHSPHLSHPDEVAAVLTEAAARARTNG